MKATIVWTLRGVMLLPLLSYSAALPWILDRIGWDLASLPFMVLMAVAVLGSMFASDLVDRFWRV